MLSIVCNALYTEQLSPLLLSLNTQTNHGTMILGQLMVVPSSFPIITNKHQTIAAILSIHISLNGLKGSKEKIKGYFQSSNWSHVKMTFPKLPPNIWTSDCG